jgi:hypothetical protein
LTSLHVCRGNPGATTVQHAARTMHVQFSTHTHTHAHTGEHRHTRRESKVGGIVNTLGWRAAFFNEVGTEVGRALPVPDGGSQADEFAPDLQQQSPAPSPPLARRAGSRSLEMPAAQAPNRHARCTAHCPRTISRHAGRPEPTVHLPQQNLTGVTSTEEAQRGRQRESGPTLLSSGGEAVGVMPTVHRPEQDEQEAVCQQRTTIPVGARASWA